MGPRLKIKKNFLAAKTFFKCFKNFHFNMEPRLNVSLRNRSLTHVMSHLFSHKFT